MSVPLRITFRNLPHSDAIEARIREKAQKLDRFQEFVTDVHVVVDSPHNHHHKGRIYTVSLELHVGGHEFNVNRDSGKNHGHEDVYVAMRDSFEAAVRQLDAHANKVREQQRARSV
ncbi:MAG: ribosome-associated translation inhibitor RaiA [Myxococcales bacterium]|nr:ribosome-associated translation inhibitor RaiA [Myxococcales bacterium]